MEGRGAPEEDASLGVLEGDLGSWKRGLEAQMGEVLRLAAPLAPALAQLQRQNRQLRAQLQRLALAVQRHGRLLGEGEAEAVQSLDLEDWNLDSEERLGRGEGGGSPESKWGPSQVLQAKEDDKQPLPKERAPAKSTVKTWSATSTRTASAVSSERFSSITKSVSAVSYESTSTTNLPSGAPPQSPSPPAVVHHQTERRRELVRSQTLPRTSSAQARKALFEKFEQDAGGKGKGGGRPKLKRSQSFGVASASSIKQILLDWCRSKTIGYKHIDLQNFSCSWNDGMAFCALVHSFFPEAFDYQALEPGKRKENFELAFTTAEKMAGCDRLIEVEDMLAMGRKPDPMCVFTYVQSLYNHLRHFE